ncbi:DUF411 domain-containing protein [Thiolapillus brandeum]|uniref:DUF411 domain-containing protein n=1 Tax=Thiolapillus brandeum TaxID=1076588 RepID=A0A7U6GJ08_9GAMM|nr:DUF411 domain-containing protein [Thiolapillus brandeum]BAO44473.1 conserved hypothetical protein [Thiolapillus brandeum]
MSNKKRNKPVLWTALSLALMAGASLLAFQPRTSSAADLVVYKSPTCGCCRKWVRHMRENGFSVEVHEQYNVTPKKDEYGVPRQLRSCHSARIGGYVVEGHVPADVVKQLLKEKPAIAGVAVPGMPMGSPGMEGTRKDPYDVFSFTDTGKTGIYASR